MVRESDRNDRTDDTAAAPTTGHTRPAHPAGPVHPASPTGPVHPASPTGPAPPAAPATDPIRPAGPADPTGRRIVDKREHPTTRSESGSSAPPTGQPAVRSWKLWVALVGFALIVWFFFAWLALDRHILDAAGESVGTAFALGVLVSLVGALRTTR